MTLTGQMLATYISQAYVSAIGIICVPLQVSALGLEGYGLVGVLVMLQAWFLLLDFGRVALITRKAAHIDDLSALEQALQRAERAVGGMAIMGAILIASVAGIAASQWFKQQQLSSTEITTSLCLMAAVLATRLVGEVYRGVLVGTADLSWLAGSNAITATVRNLVVLLAIPTSPWDPTTTFFGFQFFCCLFETVALSLRAHRKLMELRFRPSFGAPAPRISQRFPLQMAGAALIWVLISQLDKMVIAGMLPLKQFGVFSMALALASGVVLIAAPFGTLTPVKLTALGGPNSPDAISFYRASSRLAAVLVGGLASVLALNAGDALYLWTGDPILADTASTVFACYVVGNAIQAISAFPYFLQFSSGDMRFHLLGSLLFAAVLVPSMIWGARNLGMNGAGYAWLGTNLIYAALWLPLVHSRVDHILHRRWIYQDIAPGFGGALLGALLGGLIPISVARFELSVRLMIVFVLAVAMAWVGARFAGGRLARCKKELRKVSD